MPFPVTEELLARGQQRYNIYCAPCHSRVGDGNGVIPSRGFPRKPPSYHTDRLRKAPLGYLFDIITNGFGAMPDYASQIPVLGSLGDRGLHSRSAIEPGRHRGGRAGRTEGSFRAAAVSGAGSGATLPVDVESKPAQEEPK